MTFHVGGVALFAIEMRHCTSDFAKMWNRVNEEESGLECRRFSKAIFRNRFGACQMFLE